MLSKAAWLAIKYDEIAAPPVEDAEEARWVARARAGDNAAYGWLLQRYRRRAVQLAAHVLRRPSEAEDVAQEAFIRAFRELRSLKNDQRFYAWLCRILVRICLDRQRLSRWHSELALDALEVVSPDHSNTLTERMAVEMLLDQLSPPLRAALALRELEGMEYSEIADTLQIPIGTVRSRINVAREQFRNLWDAANKEHEQ